MFARDTKFCKQGTQGFVKGHKILQGTQGFAKGHKILQGTLGFASDTRFRKQGTQDFAKGHEVFQGTQRNNYLVRKNVCEGHEETITLYFACHISTTVYAMPRTCVSNRTL